MPRSLRLYVLAVSTLGLAAVLLGVAFGRLDGIAARSASPLADVIFFTALGCLLDMMIVPMARGGAVSAGFSVFYAVLLTLGPYIASFVALVATCCTDLLTRRQVPLYKTMFNVGHSVLSLMLAGFLYYHVLGGEIGKLYLATPVVLLRVLLVAFTLFLTEISAVNLAVALERKTSFRSVSLANAHMVIPLDAALAGVGLLVALIFQYRDTLFQSYGQVFIAIILLIPSLLLFYASKLYADMHRVYDKTLHTLSSLMESKLELHGAELRHYESAGHGQRVATMAVSLGEALSLPADDLQALRYAGYLHDIGKVGVPIERGPDDDYLQPTDNHPAIGFEVLQPIVFLKRVALVVRDHHQRYDFPDWAAPDSDAGRLLCSQVLHVAEAYESMVSPSRGHAALDPGQAVDRIVRDAGARFNPRVVGALVRLLLHQRVIGVVQAERALHAI